MPRTHIKIRVTQKDTHIHCSIFEAEVSGGTRTYAKNGDLIFSPDAFWAFVEALQRGRSNAYIVEVEGA